MIATEHLDRLTASASAPIALAYGRHIVAGNLILRDDQANQSVLFVALGEGEWDSAETVWFNGAVLPTASYHFHPGKDGETGTGGVDGDQKVDLWFPGTMTGLTFSRTAYLAINAADTTFAPSDDFDVRGQFKCLKVQKYDSGGSPTVFEWTANPFWCASDTLLRGGETAGRIDWASVIAAADYADATLTIDSVPYPRFECNVAFPRQENLGTVLQHILATARGYIFDDGGTIQLRADQDRASVHTFGNANIVRGSFRHWNRDTRTAPNRLRVEFRDIENDSQLSSVLVEREWHQELIGKVNEKKLDLGRTYQQQARRIGEYYETRAVDDQAMVAVTGMQDCVHLQPGDAVTVDHFDAPWDGAKKFEVIEISEDAGAETRELLLQEYDVLAFTDTSEPRQLVENGVIVGPATIPAGKVTSFNASESKYVSPVSGGGDGTVWSEVTASWIEPAPLGTYFAGRLYKRLLDAALNPVESWQSVGIFEDSPGRFLIEPSATYVSTGDTLELGLASINAGGRENSLATMPTTTVVLDELPSAPAAVSSFWCQTAIENGFRLSLAPNLESNLARYRFATTGDLAPAADGDIKDVHIVHTEAARSDSQAHVIVDIYDTVYEADSDGTTLTPVSLVLQVDGADKQLIVGGVGRKVTIQGTDGVESEHQVVSHATATITFTAASIPTGRVKVWLRGLDGKYNFYAAAENSSDQRSAWRPVPPATLECVPYDREGTPDIDTTGPYWAGLVGDPATFIIVSPSGAGFRSPPGGFALNLAAISLEENETDPTKAEKKSINSITHVQVEITHSADGVSADKKTERMPAIAVSTVPENYAQVVILTKNFWRLHNSIPFIELADRAIHTAGGDAPRARLKNSRGWGQWILIGHFGPNPNGPFWTGNARTEPVAVELAASGSFTPNIAQTHRCRIELSGNLTQEAPEERAAGAAAGSGITPIDGQLFLPQYVQPAAGGARVTFASAFEGTDELTVDTGVDRVTAYGFQKVAGTWTPFSYLTFTKKP